MNGLNLRSFKKVVVLTGAGISLDSGLSTYRGSDGRWKDPAAERFWKSETLRNEPERTLEFFSELVRNIHAAQPNDGHRVLAEMESAFESFTLITLNVDGLHQAAGSLRVEEIHGSLRRTRCFDDSCSFRGVPSDGSQCLLCGARIRPDVVLYGEFLDGKQVLNCRKALRECDLFVAVGTSGIVHPAATFVDDAQQGGAETLYLNTEETDNICFSSQRIGPASRELRRLFCEAFGSGGRRGCDNCFWLLATIEPSSSCRVTLRVRYKPFPCHQTEGSSRARGRPPTPAGPSQLREPDHRVGPRR